MYKLLIRPILFLFDPEKVHYFSFFMIRVFNNIGFGGLFRSLFQIKNEKLERELFGIKFPNPVGLAAGFDKNADLYKELSNFGFGFIEIGTVTPKGQIGNEKKRLFRLKKDQGIINRMGFNNDGVKAAAEKLKSNTNIIIGGNIGKNTQTLPEKYSEDYLTCFNELHPYVDYFVLNVSCPNVSSHAKLKDKDYLEKLITAVQKANKIFKKQKPILLKIAPDLNNSQLDEIIELVKITSIDGVIASNTSIARDKLLSENKKEMGGLSGNPITEKSTEVIRYLHSNSNGSFPIIGVGGIHSEKDALDKLNAGASLVQLYTGFIYEGPGLVKRLNKAILKG
ncbi:MAG: quinone-dependent dihydroorotate dehydrogenase [Flavobacteriaceae bacterium]|nr:quinone-dependent dihydroorotate dehydrogenase [Flavobacteriaceae bacterium]